MSSTLAVQISGSGSDRKPPFVVIFISSSACLRASYGDAPPRQAQRLNLAPSSSPSSSVSDTSSPSSVLPATFLGPLPGSNHLLYRISRCPPLNPPPPSLLSPPSVTLSSHHHHHVVSNFTLSQPSQRTTIPNPVQVFCWLFLYLLWCSFSRLLGLSRRWVEAWLGTEVQRCELEVGTRSGGDWEQAKVELVGGRLLRVVMLVGAIRGVRDANW